MARVKRFKIKGEDVREILLGWTGADGCYATDMIVVDGKRINEMVREEPVNSYDSGWRFFEGSESTGYLSNPENAGAYSLNFICNYCSDIIPYLHEPVGSSYKRDSKGNLVKE